MVEDAAGGSLCTSVSRARGERLCGTASRVRNWILLEQPGPWGRDALLESRLDPGFAQALSERAEALRIRVILLRRAGRTAPGIRRCFLAHTGPRARWVEERPLADLDELLAADLEALAGGARPGFGPVRERPLYLVCTNGRHDQCCATHGRPLAQVMAASLGEPVWESSHIGGDRFAANLLCFPDGLYFGRVGPDDGLRIAALYQQGRIDLDHYRGRSSQPPLVQAAEYLLRRHQRLHRVDDLLAEDGQAHGGGEVTVRFSGPAGVGYRVRVHAAPAAEGRLLTCTSSRPLRPPTYRLVDVGVERPG